MKWPWPQRSVRNAEGLTGDSRPISASQTAQLIDAYWPEPRAILVAAELTDAGAGSGTWTLSWGVERATYRADQGSFGTVFTRVVIARSVKLTFTANAAVPAGATAKASAAALDACVCLDASSFAFTPTSPIVVGSPAVASLAQVPVSVVDVLISPAFNSWRGRTVFNHSPAARNLFLRLGVVAATTAAYTVRLVPNAYYEVPFDYIGDIHGIWDGADGAGFANVTGIA